MRKPCWVSNILLFALGSVIPNLACAKPALDLVHVGKLTIGQADTADIERLFGLGFPHTGAHYNSSRYWRLAKGGELFIDGFEWRDKGRGYLTQEFWVSTVQSDPHIDYSRVPFCQNEHRLSKLTLFLNRNIEFVANRLHIKLPQLGVSELIQKVKGDVLLDTHRAIHGWTVRFCFEGGKCYGIGVDPHIVRHPRKRSN